MKKILMMLVIALAAPVFAAATVNVTIQDLGSGWAAINYAVTDANVVAFGINVSVNSSAKITGIRNYKTGESTAASKGFGVFPGTIGIDVNGNVTTWGKPIAPNSDPGASGTGLGTGTVVLELGALYAIDANKPAMSGKLCELQVSKCCDMSVAVNGTRCGKTSGGLDAGVVLDNATALIPTMDTNKRINYSCVSTTCATCKGDLNGDNMARTTDISALVSILNSKSPSYTVRPSDSAWNPCGDLNNDGLIRTTDLSVLVGYLNNASPSFTIRCSARTWP